MELPAGSVQEYIRIAGIAAVYVASSPSGVCRIDASRDLKRTQTFQHKQGHDLTIVSAFWVDNPKTATRIASRVNKAIRHAGGMLTVTEATMLITAIAAKLKVRLTEHAAVTQRAESAMAHVRMTLERARKTGGLQWFNSAYRDFRSRAKACGRPAMNYAQAHARLRQVILRRGLAGERSGFGAEILAQVFPELWR